MPASKLELARQQLSRVQVAAIDPVDGSDLCIYGFHALENAPVAAADHLSIPRERNHPNKVFVARTLASQHGLPDVSGLLSDLNSLRKSEAYGEMAPSRSRSAKGIAVEIEVYVEAVAVLMEGRNP